MVRLDRLTMTISRRPAPTSPVGALPRKVSVSPSAASSSVVKVMMPSPPNWKRRSSTPWPRGVNQVAVSTTVRPVTQTALVAVKRAWSGVSRAPV